VLYGRDAECERLDALLDRARGGKSDTLLLFGGPGVGKSALLKYVVAGAEGMTVVWAQGVESDSDLAFSGLLELLRPLLGLLERLPVSQASALRVVLAVENAGAVDRFSVGAATLGLLAAAAETEPLLVVVDDVHWLDSASRDALLFAARRLDADRVAVLLSARSEEADCVAGGDVLTLEISGLDAQAAKAVLAGDGSRQIADDVSERLVAATQGNPLALVELPVLLSDTQLAGSEPLDEPLPLGPSLERAFRRRLFELPLQTRQLLLLVAATDSSELGPVLRAAAPLGLAAADLEPAETADLVRIDGDSFSFRHPLLRSAVYYTAAPTDRRRAHRALADALDGYSEAERRAWHLAAAALGPDDGAASALADAAVSARKRGGHAAAASALERAAQLSSSPAERAERMLGAAQDLQFAGRLDQSLQLLDQVLQLTGDALVRSDAKRLRARILSWTGAPAEAHRLWLQEAALIEPIDPARAAAMMAEAAIVSTMTGDVREVVATAEQAYALFQRFGIDDVSAMAVYSNALILSGQAERALPLLDRCQAAFDRSDPLATMTVLIQPLAHGRTWLEQYVQARASLWRTIIAARDAGAAGLLPFPLACLAELEIRTGHWAAAYANATESVRLAEETGQAGELCFSLIVLATIEAGLGHEQDCRTHTARALAGADQLGIGSILVYAASVLGFLELGESRSAHAVVHLERVARLARDFALREPGVIWWAADLIEAYARAGRRTHAQRELAAFDQLAAETQRVWAFATAARCRGLLADEDDFEEAFRDALAWHDRAEMPFERARTELCLGERLRRARRRSEARDPLHHALETFKRLEAAPWAARADAELRATGVTTTHDPRKGAVARRLTPQELQVALCVADGASNREAAAALFVSSKTIEFHLANVYRKLELRSRSELARAIATQQAESVAQSV